MFSVVWLNVSVNQWDLGQRLCLSGKYFNTATTIVSQIQSSIGNSPDLSLAGQWLQQERRLLSERCWWAAAKTDLPETQKITTVSNGYLNFTSMSSVLIIEFYYDLYVSNLISCRVIVILFVVVHWWTFRIPHSHLMTVGFVSLAHNVVRLQLRGTT